MAQPQRGDARNQILEAAVQLIKERGARNVTVEGVARQAGCAKGLVHYHFKTKAGMLESVADQLAATRRDTWSRAFDAPTPRDAIDRSWTLLTEESRTGVVRAWMSLFASGGVLADQKVNSALAQFSSALGEAVSSLMRHMELQPTIPPSEIGWLLGAIVNGMGFQLLSGARGEDLEGAYAAAWLGILSLYAPRGG